MRNIAIDCNELSAMTAFWSRLLDFEMLFESEGAALLGPHSGDTPRIYLQRVPEPRRGKNRVHVDLYVSPDALEVAVERAESLGAARVGEHHEEDFGWWVLADPEGNLFCLAGMPFE